MIFHHPSWMVRSVDDKETRSCAEDDLGGCADPASHPTYTTNLYSGTKYDGRIVHRQKRIITPALSICPWPLSTRLPGQGYVHRV
jgi:hypothetical protein